MNVLFIGDIFASTGRSLVGRHLQEIISSEKIQLAIANAENSAGGFGITPLIAEELFGMGLAVPPVRSSNFGHGGYCLPRYAEAVEDVVPGYVVRDESEERSQRVGLAESAWAGQLSDGL